MKQICGLTPPHILNLIDTFELRLDPLCANLNTYFSSWVNWVTRATPSNLTDLNSWNKYHCNGVHDAILNRISLVPNHQPICTVENDYPFYKHLLINKNHIIVKNLSDLPNNSLFLMSFPNITGIKLEPAIQQCELTKSLLFIDCAYVGTTASINLDLNSAAIDSVAFSLSKAFNLGPLRIGILFTRSDVPALQIAQKTEYLYFNWPAVALGIKILNSSDPVSLPQILKPIQQVVCDQYQLVPLAPWLVAQSMDPKWAPKSRDKLPPFRFCITDLITNELKNNPQMGHAFS